MSTLYRPIQIMAAERGWLAAFRDDDKELWFEPLVCWALCERYECGDENRPVGWKLWNLPEVPFDRDVVGMIRAVGEGIEAAEAYQCFVGYMREGESSQQLEMDALWLERPSD